jgi:hypothetical protein
LGPPAVQSALLQQPVGAVATHVVLVAVQSRKPPLHAGAPQEVPLHVGAPLAGVGQTVHAVPQWLASLATQVVPHLCSGEVHVKSQLVLLLQVAVPPAGAGQGVHEVPQELVLLFREQTPLQS